jgi:hypothetical protein
MYAGKIAKSVSATLVSQPRLRWLLSVTVLICLAVASAPGATTKTVTLAWDPSPDPSVLGYCVHYGTASRAYTGSVDANGATKASVSGLVPGRTYYFAVTAYNQQRIESAPSGEIVYTVPSPVLEPIRLVRRAGSTPPVLRFRVKPMQAYAVQVSEDMKSWRTVHRRVSLSTDWIEWLDPQAARSPQRFYRLAVPDLPPAPGWIELQREAIPSGSICLRPLVSAGQHYRIEASRDLKTWERLHEGIAVAGRPFNVVVAEADRIPGRFYRLALLDASSGSGALQILRGRAVGGSRLRVAAMEGQRYRIEASTDLNQWTSVHEGVAHSTGPVELLDPHADIFTKRFYRLAFEE